MDKFHTTLNKIRDSRPGAEDWAKLLKKLGKTEPDNEPLPFRVILESNDLDYALWCCRAAPEYDKEWRLYAVFCARQVQHLLTDERYENGLETAAELAAAAGQVAGVAAGHVAGIAARVAWEVAGLAAWVAAVEAQTIKFREIISGETV